MLASGVVREEISLQGQIEIAKLALIPVVETTIEAKHAQATLQRREDLDLPPWSRSFLTKFLQIFSAVRRLPSSLGQILGFNHLSTGAGWKLRNAQKALAGAIYCTDMELQDHVADETQHEHDRDVGRHRRALAVHMGLERAGQKLPLCWSVVEKIAMVQHLRAHLGEAELAEKIFSLPSHLTSIEYLPDSVVGLRSKLKILNGNDGARPDGPFSPLQMLRTVKVRPSRGKHLHQLAFSTDLGVVLHQCVGQWPDSHDVIVSAKPETCGRGIAASMLDLVDTQLPPETFRSSMSCSGECLHARRRLPSLMTASRTRSPQPLSSCTLCLREIYLQKIAFQKSIKAKARAIQTWCSQALLHGLEHVISVDHQVLP